VFHFLRRGQNGDNVAGGEDRQLDGQRGGQSEFLPQRPPIGLVLGGGAARGFAHIGVIRTLIAKGLVPDVIAGTSIGAVVGGCYAAGNLDGVEQWCRSLTRRSVLSYLDVSFSGSALLGGGRLAEKLIETAGDVSIEQLPVRFAAIATEFGTGHEIWLTRGPLVEAARASYALPGMFPPIYIGGRWLMDGALVNPVPISTARALGARVVIAVNVNTDLYGRGTTIQDHGGAEPGAATEATMVEIVAQRSPLGRFASERADKRRFFGEAGRPGLSTIMVEAFNVMQDRLTRARLAGQRQALPHARDSAS